MARDYTDTELVAEIQELAREYGRAPTLQELRDTPEAPSATTYYERFGSWQDALEAAGFEPRQPTSEIDREELLDEIHTLTEELGTIPTAEQMDEQGEFWASTYRNQFGSWTQAIEEAGYEPREPDRPIPREELLEALESLAEDVEGTPTRREMNEKGEFPARRYYVRFGSWSEALEAAGFEPNPQGGEVSVKELRAELERVADIVDGEPSAQDMEEYGEYTRQTYTRRFGSWDAAVDELLSE